MKKIIIKVGLFLLSVYVLICVVLYFNQESILFFPEVLNKNYSFEFPDDFEELNFQMNDQTNINGLLFKTPSSKGLIFYLHGNAGSLKGWGKIAPFYNQLGYDIFFMDYRGFGKSRGTISNQKQLFEDVQLVYDSLKTRYNEKKMVILGYSIGTGIAAHLASENNASQLILEAPYFSMLDMMKNNYPFLPAFILKYPLPTNIYISRCKMPIVIFHGNKDQVIPYSSSVRLSKLLKTKDRFISLKGQGHNGISDHTDYQNSMQHILN